MTCGHGCQMKTNNMACMMGLSYMTLSTTKENIILP